MTNTLTAPRPTLSNAPSNQPGYANAPGYAQFERLTDTRKRLGDTIAFLSVKLAPITAQRIEPEVGNEMAPGISALEDEINFMQTLINSLNRLGDSIVL